MTHIRPPTLGLSGRITAFFLQAQITPLLALLAFLLGAFAVLTTPREEEPQINVTMANVLIPFPGASVRDVEQMVSSPAEQLLSGMEGTEHVMSVSRPGLAVLTVQFKVGVARTEALVRLHDTLRSHQDFVPSHLGVLQPLIRPKGIDDVPIVSFTLHSTEPQTSAFDLERVAYSVESELQRVAGVREVRTLGGPGRAILVEIDPTRMAASGVSVPALRAALQSANLGLPIGDLLAGEKTIALQGGAFLSSVDELATLIVGTRNGKPIFLQDLATLSDGPPPAQRMVWFGKGGEGAGQEWPAVTIQVTKKPGENAIDVANALTTRITQLHNTIIPDAVQIAETRNYGTTANDKAQKLIQKLLFATASVVALVFIALGRREAAIVGLAVILTLAATLFASWAWGFTLNRVSLFALIFSIGILVDDAIVVVENIHRHQQLQPHLSLLQSIPGAVDEVGGPTILATFTVIAALLPMAFVSGLMGPYMAPIPINASMGMLISLAIAFVVTPWLAQRWMKSPPHPQNPAHPSDDPHPQGLSYKLEPLLQRLFTPLLDSAQGTRHRALLGLSVLCLIAFSVALPVWGLVQLKMLPFDNKSEFQVVVDMPAGTPLEDTAAVLRELGAHLATIAEVRDYQAYVGTASPINFNGLVRQYDLRAASELGDIQVNLVDKNQRKEKSHAIAMRVRPALQAIGQRWGANVKVVEVPPGPPVMAPIVAEIYGPEASGRREITQAVRSIFEKTPGVVDVDSTTIAAAPRKWILVDRRKAALAGISQQAIVTTLNTALSGEATTYLHDGSRIPVPVWVQLPAKLHGSLEALLQLQIPNATGKGVPISELITLSDTLREQPIYHKNLLSVDYIQGDMAGRVDSPLYGMFTMRNEIAKIIPPGSQSQMLQELFVEVPQDAQRYYYLRWDGEWRITYETFRDMGAAYAVGLILIYLLVVAQFGSYLTPLIIMAPIPLTVIGVMPGHALLGAQFTATSMIGMIALAGIIVRNSILLVDFIRLQQNNGMPLAQAVVHAVATRTQPIILTGMAAMIGAFFILDDPIFNGLAIALIFGILVSTILTLVVIPTLYYAAYRHTPSAPTPLVNN